MNSFHRNLHFSCSKNLTPLSWLWDVRCWSSISPISLWVVMKLNEIDGKHACEIQWAIVRPNERNRLVLEGRTERRSPFGENRGKAVGKKRALCIFLNHSARFSSHARCSVFAPPALTQTFAHSVNGKPPSPSTFFPEAKKQAFTGRIAKLLAFVTNYSLY